MPIINAVIVEDSRLARLELSNQLGQHPDIHIVAQCEDADSAISALEQHQPDLVFMDIQLPGKNGFEILDALSFQPKVIFITAYDEFALRSFDYEAIDYLLKPVEAPRLAQALTRLRKSYSDEPTAVLPLTAQSSVFIKDGEQCWMVELVNIVQLVSAGNYTQVQFANHQPLLHKSLNLLEQRLPAELFFRANRQQIINIKHIASVELSVAGNLELVLNDGTQVEVSRRHSTRFKQLLSL